MKKNTDLNKNLKIKLLFIFFFSNICIYLLASPSNEEFINDTKENIIQKREDYIEIKVSGNLLTSFSKNKAISLISKNKRLFIPYALLISQKKEFIDDLTQEEIHTSYLIYVSKNHLPKIISGQKFDLLPYGKHNLKNPQKRNYEIHI